LVFLSIDEHLFVCTRKFNSVDSDIVYYMYESASNPNISFIHLKKC